MKKQLLICFTAAITFGACNSGTDKSTPTDKKEKDVSVATNTAKVTEPSGDNSNTAESMKVMVGQYLQMKNALVNDNGKEAAAAGNAFVTSMGKMERTTLSPDKLKIWDNLSDDAKEMAEHVGMNGSKLDHQREHFEMLSNDMYDMVKAFGGGQVLYKDFCPMYNNNKGAIWLSEIKEIKNPYLGKKMPTCGSVKEEIK